MKDYHYFTPAELAKLTGISKQLLLYYDKNKIFSPNYVDDNGYRFYILSQYFTLQIIVSLRKLGVPLKDIKIYLQNKDLEQLKALYKQKLVEYRIKIDELKHLEKIINSKIEFLNSIQDIPLNRILLENQNEEHLYFSEDIKFKSPVKDRIKMLAKHMLPVFSCQTFHDYLMGFYYNSSDFLYSEKIEKYNVFIQANRNLNYPNPKMLTKEKGLYICLYCNAFYGVVDKKIKKSIVDFINRNKLVIQSGVYVFPLRNFWSTSKKEDEIVKLSIKVDYVGDSV